MSLMAFRKSSSTLMSRKVSTAPSNTPFLSRNRAVEILMGNLRPSASIICTFLLTIGSPVFIVARRQQLFSQMSALRTSLHSWPMASSLGTPVIFSAARLKDVIRQSLLTVKTPSAMESRMIFCPSIRCLDKELWVLFNFILYHKIKL